MFWNFYYKKGKKKRVLIFDGTTTFLCTYYKLINDFSNQLISLGDPLESSDFPQKFWIAFLLRTNREDCIGRGWCGGAIFLRGGEDHINGAGEVTLFDYFYLTPTVLAKWNIFINLPYEIFKIFFQNNDRDFLSIIFDGILNIILEIGLRLS